MDTTGSVRSLPRNGIKHGRASSLALPLSLGVGGIMKQRPVILESSLGPAQSSSAPSHLNFFNESVASVDATRKAEVSKLHRKGRHETTIANLTTLAMRGLFLLALLAFLRALLGLDPFPVSLGPFADHMATTVTTTRSSFHHRAIRVIRAAHENVEQSNPVVVDADGQVTLAQDYLNGIKPTAGIDVKLSWAGIIGDSQNPNPTAVSGTESQLAAESTPTVNAKVNLDMRENPPVVEGAAVHVHSSIKQNQDTNDVRDGRHGRRKGARYSYY